MRLELRIDDPEKKEGGEANPIAVHVFEQAVPKGFGRSLWTNRILVTTSLFTLCAILFGFYQWRQAAQKRREDVTFQYIRPLQEDDFTSALWRLEEVTK